MTSYFEEDRRCALCSSVNEFSTLGSTNTFGSADLDTRPPEMQRSTMYAWVQRCPSCGYCAADISKSHTGSAAVVARVQYREQLNNPTYPGLANSFLCNALIQHEANDYKSATWALVKAAWVCDDANLLDAAAACRRKAADMLLTAQGHDQQVSVEDGVSTAILVDLLRRSGQPDAARQAIVERPAEIPDIVGRILDYQSMLIEKGDTTAHVISEALNWARDR